MLQIPERTLENAMIALICLDMGEGVEKVAEAALNLLRRGRRQREKEAQGPLRGQATVVEVNAAEASTNNAPVGVPRASPRDAQATRHRGSIPAGYSRTVKDAAVQTEAHHLPIETTWDELRDRLVNARALDLAATRARSEVFEALDRYVKTCAEPHPEATYWRRLAAAKRKEVDHLVAWRAERRARIQREREAEEAQLRVVTERALEEARTRRLAEEAELQAVRARWKAARRDEEKAAAELGLAEERPQPAQLKPPGSGRLRHCKCPRVATHLPRPDAPLRG